MLATKDLTPAERLWVWRRRAGKNQQQAAAHWGISTWDYRLRETDDRGACAPPVNLGRLLPHEACSVLRRRSGYSRKEVAKRVGVSPWWVTQMERGRIDADRLIAYWFPF